MARCLSQPRNGLVGTLHEPANERRAAETAQTPGDCEGRGREPSAEIRIAYLKLLPREYDGPRHIANVGQRADGRGEYEERPGAPPTNQDRRKDENVMTIFFVRAQQTGSPENSQRYYGISWP
jgi:hypothetical protein